jgi:fructose-1,6-bisphosphatase I
VQSTSIYYRTSGGGKASDGFNRIMEIEPTELHERVPFFAEVTTWLKKAEEFIQNKIKQILKSF